MADEHGGRGAPAHAAEPRGEGRPPEPWQRFAWVLGGIWVVFMGFPITAAATADASPTARIAATAVLCAYAVAYVLVYLWMIRTRDWYAAGRRGLVGLGVLATLMIVAALLIGIEALGAGAFLVTIAMFSGPARRAVPMAVAIFVAEYAALTIWLSVLPNGFADYGILYMPPAIVLITVGAVRLIETASERHEILERQRDLVAERERVARDVHDVLGHSLTIVTVKAELAERLVELDPVRAKAEIAQIRSLSREALAEVRATVAGLRVARLGDELAAAAEALRAAGIEADVPSEPDEVDPRYRIIVAWVLREAVTNVVRHSRAQRCAVTLVASGIVVEDDGVGIPPGVAERGLRGIRERATAAGATLSVGAGDPAAGDGRGPGTRVEVRW